jgi:hypothetical protein
MLVPASVQPVAPGGSGVALRPTIEPCHSMKQRLRAPEIIVIVGTQYCLGIKILRDSTIKSRVFYLFPGIGADGPKTQISCHLLA